MDSTFVPLPAAFQVCNILANIGSLWDDFRDCLVLPIYRFVLTTTTYHQAPLQDHYVDGTGDASVKSQWSRLDKKWKDDQRSSIALLTVLLACIAVNQTAPSAPLLMPLMGAGAWFALMGLGTFIVLRQAIESGWGSPLFQERLESASRNKDLSSSLQFRVLLCWPATMVIWAFLCLALYLAIALTLGLLRINPSARASIMLGDVVGGIGTIFATFATAQSLRAARVFQ